MTEKKRLSSHNRLQLETKDKFDALLKQALNSKKVKNARNRILLDKLDKEDVLESLASTKSSIRSHHDEKVKIVQADVHEQVETNKDFILHKFLHDTANTINLASTDQVISLDPDDSDVVFIKPPVPRPRQKVKAPSVSSVSMDGTYVVESAGISKENVDVQQLKSVKNPGGSLIYSASSCKSAVEVNPTRRSSVSEQNGLKNRSEDLASTAPNMEADGKVIDCVANNFLNATAITIHKADYFNLDLLHVQLTVKVHVVNRKSGEYIKCSNKPSSTEVCYIIPMKTEHNNLHEQYRSLTPRWEETLKVYEDIDYILKQENKPIIFFEVLYILNETNMIKVAWAFLKILSKTGESNVEKRMRLQLYYPNVDYKNVPTNVCNMFHWWKGKKLVKYPSTLYVSIRSIKIPQEIHSLQVNTFGDMNEFNKNNEKLTPWSRLQYQTCKLPNRCIFELYTYDEGCFVMKFSNSGLFLACAVLIDDVYTVVIFSVINFEEICKYSAHQGLIYSIVWSKDDQIIVTASADCTVCVWSFLKRTYIEMLPHPAYVYAATISHSNLIATGCYDQIVRIWRLGEIDGGDANLIQELEHHESYITSVCFNNKSTILYSADSAGIIIEWMYTNTWNIRRVIKLVDLRDTVINQILLHGRERRMVIHARDSTMRIIDLKTEYVLSWLHGGLNTKFQSVCSLSSCGTFVAAGSENGSVNVWNVDTGHQIASYNFSNNTVPILCAEFHPQDNMLAISCYCPNLPIRLLVYDPSYQNSTEVGLIFLETNTKIQKKSKKFKNAAMIITEKTNTERRHKFKLEEVIEKIDQIIVTQSLTTPVSSKN